MSSMSYLPIVNDGEVEMYKRLEKKVLADKARQDEEEKERERRIDLGLPEFAEKPQRKWNCFRTQKKSSSSSSSNGRCQG